MSKLNAGTIYENNSGLKYEIVDIVKTEIRKNPSGDKIVKWVRIKFIESGYTSIIESSSVLRGNVKDNYQNNILGVARLGDSLSNPIYEETKGKLYSIYYDMISRCYNPKNNRYSHYGAIGVKVADEWLDYNNFLNDAVKLPGYNYDRLGRGGLVFDKDVLQLNIPKNERIYSKSTCKFIEEHENNFISNSESRKYITRFIDPNGITHIPSNKKEFCKKHNVCDSRTIYKVKRGNSHKLRNGWIIEND